MESFLTGLQGYLASGSSSSQGNAATVIITFDDWKSGPIFDWYTEHSRNRPPYIRRMELWKERRDFKHEFVVLYLDGAGAPIYRIDRRPLIGPNPDAVFAEGCKVEDSIMRITKFHVDGLRSEADVQIEVDFNAPEKPDFYLVIAICVAVQMDEESRNYTLQRYNCFFLARTIITLVIRHYLIQSSMLFDNLRWDNVTALTLARHIDSKYWSGLDMVLRAVISEALGRTLWSVIKADAEKLVEEPKQLAQLRLLTREATQDATRKADSLIDPLEPALVGWMIAASEATLWRGSLGEQLSEPTYRHTFERAIEVVLKRLSSPELRSRLPVNIITKFGTILPKRSPSTSLPANVPPNFFAQISVNVMETSWETLPVEVLVNLPPEALVNLPSESLEKIPDDVFSRLPNRVIFTLPVTVKRYPHRLLRIALQRSQVVLAGPQDHPDRPLCLELRRQLPRDMLKQFPSTESTDISTVPTDCAVITAPVAIHAEGHIPVSTPLDNNESKPVTHASGILGLPLLKIPLVTVQPEAIAGLPTDSHFHCLERLPGELEIPSVTPSQNLTGTINGALSESPLEELPADNFLPESMGKLPESLSDSLRRALGADTIFHQGMKADLVKHGLGAVKGMLETTAGFLPETVIRISVAQVGVAEGMRVLERHEELQEYVLDMIKRHSKVVSQWSQFGLREQAVYNELYAKMESIWRVTHSRATPSTIRRAPRVGKRKVDVKLK